MDTDPEAPPHSAAYFGAERDFWWNEDYLELLGRRLELERVCSVLDVGSGLGHWTRMLSRLVADDASFVGIERDQRWVEQARERAQASGEDGRFHFEQGVAEALPYPDASFDLVTCQTLLIHVPDPRAVIGEMVRVAKPGGLVMAAEPNNRASLLVDSNVSAELDVDRKVEALRFALMIERGKALLGEGANSIGDLVPGLFADAGLENVRAWVGDKAALLVPPYESDEQRTLSDYWIDSAEQGLWTTDRDEALRHFLAGGGDATEFELLWTRRLDEEGAATRALKDNRLHTAGGQIHYVIAGRKP